MTAVSRTRSPIAPGTAAATPHNARTATKSRSTGVAAAVFAVALALAAYSVRSRPASTSIREPPQPHEVVLFDQIWSREDHLALLDYVKQVATRGNYYPLGGADSTAMIEHIGEALPMVDGGCSHPYMRPNRNRTQCVISPRVDIGLHHVYTGGLESLRESFDRLLHRQMAFASFFIKAASDGAQARSQSLDTDVPAVKTLFKSKQYREAVSRICPGTTYLEEFQLGIIIQLPGQQVAMHVDAPWFAGADRFSFPLWFLVVMKRSGLFDDLALAQLQGVAYVHDWDVGNMTKEELEATHGGSFFYYDRGEANVPDYIAPFPRSGILLDGSRVVHGTRIFHPSGEAEPPRIPPSSDARLYYNAGLDSWQLQIDGQPHGTFPTNRTRIALVWRSKCHKDAAAREAYLNAPPLQLDAVMRTLKADLIKRGRLRATEQDTISPLNLALVLLDEYVKYPVPRHRGALPFNYCVAPRVLPKTLSMLAQWALTPLCKW